VTIANKNTQKAALWGKRGTPEGAFLLYLNYPASRQRCVRKTKEKRVKEIKKGPGFWPIWAPFKRKHQNTNRRGRGRSKPKQGIGPSQWDQIKIARAGNHRRGVP